MKLSYWNNFTILNFYCLQFQLFAFLCNSYVFRSRHTILGLRIFPIWDQNQFEHQDFFINHFAIHLYSAMHIFFCFVCQFACGIFRENRNVSIWRGSSNIFLNLWLIKLLIKRARVGRPREMHWFFVFFYYREIKTTCMICFYYSVSDLK